MKVLFSKKGRYVKLVDKKRMIFEFDDADYYDFHGNPFPKETVYKDSDTVEPGLTSCESHESNKSARKLKAVSTVDLEFEIDDIFGHFGFKNQSGTFVIEPQYACASDFTCGLAAVNLNRTWYKTEDGRSVYENHYGYIDERGKTIIPFMYDEAYPFNKYEVAVVETLRETLLIDTKGNVIPGTENYSFSHYYDFDTRFFEITYKSDCIYRDDELVGIYDTKERKVVIEPSIDCFTEVSEEEICVDVRVSEENHMDCRQYYINSNGEKLYPWLNENVFTVIEHPNKSMVSIVTVSKYIGPDGQVESSFSKSCKDSKRVFMYGLYSRKGLIVPLEYEKIIEVSENVFACLKDGVYTIMTLDECDY